MSEELALELRQNLASAHQHAVKLASGPCLAKTNPEEWFEIASALLQAKSKTSLRNDKGGKWNRNTIETVLAQLDDYGGLDELKNKLAIRSARKLSIIDDLTVEAALKLQDAIESGDYAPSVRDIKDLAIASQIEHGIWLRSKGEATTIIEERKVTTEEIDTEKEKLRKRIEAAKDAEVVDV